MQRRAIAVRQVKPQMFNTEVTGSPTMAKRPAPAM
jgi:hypothetical protein